MLYHEVARSCGALCFVPPKKLVHQLSRREVCLVRPDAPAVAGTSESALGARALVLSPLPKPAEERLELKPVDGKEDYA